MNLREILSSYYKEHLTDEEKKHFEKGKTIIKFEAKMGFDFERMGPFIDINSWISEKGIKALATFSQTEPDAMVKAVKEALDNFGYEVSKALAMADDEKVAVVAEGFDNEASKKIAEKLNWTLFNNSDKKGETN